MGLFKMNIVFLGPPGSGKGTIAKKLAAEHGFKQLAPGDLFRSEMSQKTQLGEKIQAIVNAGNLVPDEITNEIVSNHISDNTIFDGYPRTINQAEALESTAKIDVVVLFHVTEEVVLERLTGRRICPKDGAIYHVKNIPPKTSGICDNDNTPLIQRKDDQPESVKERFRVYEKQTKPLVDFYKERNLLKEIDATKEVDGIYKQVKEAIGPGL